MSIYATTFNIADYDHAPDCARLVRVAGFESVWTHDDTKPCTCKAGPIAYQGSHILPTDDDPRGGCLDIGAIPGFIWDKDRPAIGDDTDDRPWWPWLRMSVNEESVVLTRDHIGDLHRALGDWLDNTEADADADDIAGTLRDTRRRRNVSQRELARLLGTSQSAVSGLETGGTDLRLSTLKRWADALGKRIRLEDIGGDR